MDWAKAIEINQTALARIVAALFAMLGLADGGVADRLPRPLYRAVLRVLRPAESAVRRLVVIAARGLVVKRAPARANPRGLAPAGKIGARHAAFQLFDPRMRFAFQRPARSFAKAGPRIAFLDTSPLAPLFQPLPIAEPVPQQPDGSAGARRLGRRLAAIKLALDDLPRQAMRLARWRIRRDRLQSPPIKSPMRPGPPPGHQKKPRDEVDRVLRECHALARDALAENTS